MSTPLPPPTATAAGPDPGRDDLSAWLDGELSPEAAADLEAELARDPALRADLEALEGVVRFVRETAPTVAPPGFAQRMLAHVEAAEAERPAGWLDRVRGWFGGLRWEAGLLGAVAVAVLVAVLPGRGPDAPPEAAETAPGAVRLPDPSRPAPPAEVEGPRAPEKLTAAPGPAEVIGRASVADDAESVARTVEVPVGSPTNLVWEGGPAPAPAAPAPDLGGAAPDADAYGFALRSSDPSMKRKVLAYAARFGRVTDADGAEIAGAALAGPEELVVRVPSAELAAFEAGLRALGFPAEAARPADLLPAGEVAVHLHLAPR